LYISNALMQEILFYTLDVHLVGFDCVMVLRDLFLCTSYLYTLPLRVLLLALVSVNVNWCLIVCSAADVNLVKLTGLFTNKPK
jgi:hypothetical protein